MIEFVKLVSELLLESVKARSDLRKTHAFMQ